MRIQHNISALNTSAALKKNQKNTASNLAKLSSGYAINKAADNAAGLALSEKMRGQIRGMEQASANATDGLNLIQTAEGYMKTANDILQRMRELAVQSANGTYDTGEAGTASSQDSVIGDRGKIDAEIQQLTDELDRIASTANFNGMKLSDKTFKFQVGANTSTDYVANGVTGSAAGTNAEQISVTIDGFDSTTLGVNTDAIDFTNQDSANTAIDVINSAITTVTGYRAKLGAVQNRLDYTIDNLATAIENTTASESAIRDTDMVAEMMEYTKNNVLNQAATAMMAQANTQTQSVLQLLQ